MASGVLLDLRQKKGTFDADKTLHYIRAHWENLDGKPATFNPALHDSTHDAHNDARYLSKDFPYSLDTPLTALNNHTLRDVFESTIPALENLISNGDFSSADLTKYSGSGTLSVISNKLSFVDSSNLDNYFFIETLSNETNHLYYFKFDFIQNGSSNLIIENSTDATNQLFGVNSLSTSGKYSGVYNRSLYTSETTILMDNAGAVYTNWQFDNVILIDLTATFGSGLEPTATEMDAIINALVMNGDFSNGTTGYVAVGGNLSISNNELLFTTTTLSGVQFNTPNISVSNDDVIYSKVILKSNTTGNSIRLFIRGDISSQIVIQEKTTYTNNVYQTFSGGIKVVGITGPNVNLSINMFSGHQIGDTLQVKYFQLFNLTASHGVTATTGTAYDNAVAEIEWLLSKNNGYFQTVRNPFEIVDLTVSQMDYWYSLYQELKKINMDDIVEGTTYKKVTQTEKDTWDAKLDSVPLNHISNTRLADVPTLTVKGRVSAGTGDPQDLTMEALKTILTYAFSDLTSHPTTLAEYGITDARTATEITNEIATAIANLVASSPGTLDTLNELAAALGDDPNFATTMTNALAGKVATTREIAGLALSADITQAALKAALAYTASDVGAQVAHAKLAALAALGTTLGIVQKNGVDSFTVVDPSSIGTINNITMNGSSNQSPTFYAPASAGTDHYILGSAGSGAPEWVGRWGYRTSRTSTSLSPSLSLYGHKALFIYDGTTTRTVTIPANSSEAFPIGTEFTFIHMNTGALQIALASGVTVNGAGSVPTYTTRYKPLKLIKTDTDAWVTLYST